MVYYSVYFFENLPFLNKKVPLSSSALNVKLVCSLDRYADLTAGTMEGLMLKPARKYSCALFLLENQWLVEVTQAVVVADKWVDRAQGQTSNTALEHCCSFLPNHLTHQDPCSAPPLTAVPD